MADENPTIQSAAMTNQQLSPEREWRHLIRSAIVLVEQSGLIQVAGLSRAAVGQQLREMVANSWDEPHASAPEALNEDALKDLAHSAYEEAMGFGLSVDVFMRYFRTIALAAPSTPAAEEASTDEILADLGWQKVECAVCGGYAHAAPSTPAAVAYVDGDDVSRRILWRDDVAAFDFPVGTTLFAAAPSTPAAALTDDEIDQIWAAASEDHDDGVNIHELARAIERYHGIGIEEAP